MNTTIVISDIHGCYDTLLELLKLCPKGDIVFAGDLVDRGPKSKEVIQFAIDNNVQCVLGNHDDMMVDSVLKLGKYEYGVWLQNGGDKTVISYNKPWDVKKLMVQHAHWLASLPLTITLGDYIISHTGHISNDRFNDLWYRGEPRYNGKYIIFGHTPHDKPNIQKKWACIDTGCAYPKYGLLTALILPPMDVISVPNKKYFS